MTLDGGQARAYEPDTLVVDVEESPATEDPTMQIRLDDGHWHRKIAGVSGLFVACGEAIVPRLGHEIRHEAFDGRLCKAGCFSPFELELGRINNEQGK